MVETHCKVRVVAIFDRIFLENVHIVTTVVVCIMDVLFDIKEGIRRKSIRANQVVGAHLEVFEIRVYWRVANRVVRDITWFLYKASTAGVFYSVVVFVVLL